MNIRLATPADVPAITAIYNHAILHTIASFWYEPRPEEELARAGADLVADENLVVDGTLITTTTETSNPSRIEAFLASMESQAVPQAA